MDQKNYPRIERLRISNFQSLGEVDIALDGFTVLVGRSNSGKSAILRALKAVVRNVNSPSSVRVGKSVFTSTVDFDDTSVSIERGKSQSTYRINLPDGREEVYTKAGRTVPDDVQGILHLPLPQGPDLVFSSQIDPPFLLSETGSAVAKTIGDLTNVSKLHAAAKESNRRRLEASKTESIRRQDAQACVEQLQERFSDLPEVKKALTEARTQFDSVRATARKVEALSSTLEDIDMCVSAEKDLKARLDELPEPSDIESLAERAGEVLGRRHAILDTLDTLSKCADAEGQLITIVQTSEKESETAETEYHDVLVQAGQCPTCGQKVSA